MPIRKLPKKTTWASKLLARLPGGRLVTRAITAAAHQAVRRERLMRASIIFKSPSLISAVIGIVFLVSLGKWNHYVLATIAGASALGDLYFKHLEVRTRHQMARLQRKVRRLQRLSDETSGS